MTRGRSALPPGERRHGFVMPMPHTRAARKTTQMYLRTLRPLAHEIAAMLKVPDSVFESRATPQEIGAAYLSAFLDELQVRLMNES